MDIQFFLFLAIKNLYRYTEPDPVPKMPQKAYYVGTGTGYPPELFKQNISERFYIIIYISTSPR
jgi:hypothetical protein